MMNYKSYNMTGTKEITGWVYNLLLQELLF